MEDEKFSRYERLKLFIKEIEDSKYSNRNVEWYDKHYNILEEYRMNFSDFTYIDNEISNKEFRQNASLVENLLKRLMTDYQKHRWFGLYDYVRLNQTLVWLADYTEQYYKKEDNLLLSLFKSLKV
jgi:hypothetical protein|uniref:Uncharacterized protein n=1 Tax=viral metagenome TaxID=1070528 RepID=A0A6C0LAJ7_9ZZZZ